MDKEEFNERMTRLRKSWTNTCIKQGVQNINTICRLYIKALDNPKYIIECTKYNCKNWDIPKQAVYNIAEGIQNKRLFEVYGAEMKAAYKKQKENNKVLYKAFQYDKYINLPNEYIKAMYYKNTKTHAYTLHDISLCKKSNLLQNY
jgi:antirestriction protein